MPRLKTKPHGMCTTHPDTINAGPVSFHQTLVKFDAPGRLLAQIETAAALHLDNVLTRKDANHGS
jgi:hypothetical protein